MQPPAASLLAASMLPVPLTVLLLFEFAATIHLFMIKHHSTLCPPAGGPAIAPQQGPDPCVCFRNQRGEKIGDLAGS